MFKTLFATSAVALALVITPAHADGHAMGEKDISLAVGAAQAVGLAYALAAGPVTVFVPTNAALEALPTDKLEAIRGDMDTLKKTIQGYAVSGEVTAAQAMEMTKDDQATVDSLGGTPITLMQQDGKLMIEGGLGTATVIGTDMKLGNVLVHFIDGAILPEGVSAD